MTTVTGQGEAPRKSDLADSGILRRVWHHRADYAYVLPAIVVMLVVIAYPVYYTIDLSFFRTPPGLQLKDKIFVGFDNYEAILASDVFWTVTRNTVIWTLALDHHLVRARLCRRGRAAPRIHGPRPVARDPHHSLGDQRGRCLLHLEVDLPLGFRNHRRGSRGVRV